MPAGALHSVTIVVTNIYIYIIHVTIKYQDSTIRLLNASQMDPKVDFSLLEVQWYNGWEKRSQEKC